MNKLFSRLKSSTIKGKKLYLFLLTILLIGVLFGSIFLTILDEADKTSVLKQVVSFFDQIKLNKINYMEVLKNSVTANLLYVTLVFISGISIVGIPIVIIMLFLKGFMIGFSLVSIIAQYKFIGLLGALTYVFPHIIITVVVILITSYFSLNLSFNILEAVIKKRNINFGETINRYCFIMILGVILMVISSLIETFISPYIIKFFLLFV